MQCSHALYLLLHNSSCRVCLVEQQSDQLTVSVTAVSPYHHLQQTSVGSAPCGTYHRQRLRSSYTAFKIAVLGEIVDRQLFEGRQLQRLFQAYLDHNSIANMPVVKMVIADLRVELNVW